jgi:hypothetical protein
MRMIVVLSTRHMSLDTIKLLAKTRLKDWPVAGGKIGHGFYVYAHDEDCEGTIPADLLKVCQWASGQGFDYIQFDEEEEPIEALPTFEETA